MISKRILISMIVIISLVQTATDTQSTAGTKAGVKSKTSAKPKSSTSKSATTATEPTEVGIKPDEDTAVEPEKPTGLRHKLFNRIKSISRPIRFLWGKFKNLKNKVQNRYKKITATYEESESG